MLHGGNTRKNTRALRLARAFNRIMEHQYKRDPSGVELLLCGRAFRETSIGSSPAGGRSA